MLLLASETALRLPLYLFPPDLPVPTSERALAPASWSGIPGTGCPLTGESAEQARLQAAFDATNKNDGGILIRLQALNRLSDTNATLQAAHWMLSLLFMCIELLPVLMKVLLNFGPPSAYDRLAGLLGAGRRTGQREPAGV